MDEQIALLLALLLAHFIADFYLQPMHWVHNRNTYHYKSTKLALHVLVHGVLSATVLIAWEHIYGLGEWPGVLLATLSIMLSHWLIDVGKSYTRGGIIPFVVDQLAHIMVIISLCLWLSDADTLTQWASQGLSTQSLWVTLLAYALVLNPCSVAIRMLLERWQLPCSHNEQQLPQAGHSIGVLERVLMLTFVLIDELAGVGFVLAAKSVFRFGDLTNSKEKHLTEYVMLGTLLSVTLTLAIGLATRALLNTL